MEKEKWYRISLAGVIIISIVSILVITNQKDAKIKELESQIDNLSIESFINSSENGRKDMAIDSLKIVNPKAGKQIEDILNGGQYE
jgi:hypothetical protein